MALYNVDFFAYDRRTRRLQNVHHDVVADPMIDDDYIAVNTSTIAILPTSNVEAGQFIYISGLYTFLGIVAGVSTVSGYTNVTIKPFVSLFDEDVLFNVRYQGRGDTSLESVIHDTLNKYYVFRQDTDADLTPYCTDYLQCLPLDISEVSSTMIWGFNLRPDIEGKNWVKCGFYSVVLVNAMKKYGIALTITPNFHRTMVLNDVTYYGVFEIKIGKPDSMLDEPFHIEADNPGVNVVEMQVNEGEGIINKLMVFNTDTYLINDAITYYVHPDHSYDTRDADRITPVVREIEYTSPSIDSSNPENSIPFPQAAADVAASSLSGQEWANLIELEVYANNDLVDPVGLQIGRSVVIHYLGDAYTSMLTGKRYGDTITLTFGSERILFTKQRR